MSSPAFQLTGNAFDASTGFGMDFGLAAFGGSDYAAYELPTYHIGSDDLTEDHRRKAAEIVLYRLGAPVSVRKWTSFRRWRINFNDLAEGNLSDLKTFFDARLFNLLPTGDPAIGYYVHWVDAEFAPVYVSPGHYSLTFEIEEV